MSKTIQSKENFFTDYNIINCEPRLEAMRLAIELIKRYEKENNRLFKYEYIEWDYCIRHPFLNYLALVNKNNNKKIIYQLKRENNEAT